MNPMDFILLIASVAVTVMSITVHGWSLNGFGPAILSVAGGVWQFWMQWHRHRSWVRHCDSGFSPGTQHLAMSAAIGWFLGMTGAMVSVMVT